MRLFSILVPCLFSFASYGADLVDIANDGLGDILGHAKDSGKARLSLDVVKLLPVGLDVYTYFEPSYKLVLHESYFDNAGSRVNCLISPLNESSSDSDKLRLDAADKIFEANYDNNSKKLSLIPKNLIFHTAKCDGTKYDPVGTNIKPILMALKIPDVLDSKHVYLEGMKTADPSTVSKVVLVKSGGNELSASDSQKFAIEHKHIFLHYDKNNALSAGSSGVDVDGIDLYPVIDAPAGIADKDKHRFMMLAIVPYKIESKAPLEPGDYSAVVDFSFIIR